MKSIFQIVILSIFYIPTAFCGPSQQFYEKNRHMFDDWDICRTSTWGREGYFRWEPDRSIVPVILDESLNANRSIAYKIGRQFWERYTDENQRAKAVFEYVKYRIAYTSDIAQFKYSDFAQNADESMEKIQIAGKHKGDCEDYAILLAVMWKAAGLRSAILCMPGHAAAMVYLPGYKTVRSWTFAGESGWIWGEATGRNNRLGWVPEKYTGKKLLFYEITEKLQAVRPNRIPVPVDTIKKGAGERSVVIFIILILGLFWLLKQIRGLIQAVNTK